MRNLVVGLDGTDSSLRALDWATRSVGPEGTIHAIAAASSIMQLGVELVTGERSDYLRYIEHELRTTWTASAAGRVSELVTHLREESPAEALSTVAAEVDADAIVVGAHEGKFLTMPTLGRTTRVLLRQLPTALIVVPDEVVGGLDDGGPVVVGIGHGEATEDAVWWAAQLADERSLQIGLVRALGDAPVFQADGVMDLLGYYLDPEQREKWTIGDIGRFASAIQETSDQQLVIDVETVPGLPALQLVEASRQASLLVIGQHWSGISFGRHTPQPLRYALAHARCPVAVIPQSAVRASV